jgi:putative ABC transport system ATP-binding protein
MSLALANVTKRYPAGVEALRGVSVEIPVGDQIAVVGPSGSGKTTLLTILGTLERPTSGAVTVAGYDAVAASDAQLAGLRAHRIGFVFQSFHLQDSMSALENVANGMLYTGMPAGARPAAGALRWRAPARRDRAGAGQTAVDHPRRRADRQPRLDIRRRGDRAAA